MRNLALVLLVVGCSKPAGTAANTKVIDWTLAQGTREAIKTATLANKAAKDFDFTDPNTGVKFRLHVETASAAYTEATSQMNLPAITALSATVVDSNGFKLEKPKCEGPNYDMAMPPTTTIIDCTMHATKPNNQSIVFWQMDGSGAVMPEGNTQKVLDTSGK